MVISHIVPRIKELGGKADVSLDDIRECDCPLPFNEDRFGVYMDLLGPAPHAPETQPYVGSGTSALGGICTRVYKYLMTGEPQQRF